jgi:hypothetical protein
MHMQLTHTMGGGHVPGMQQAEEEEVEGKQPGGVQTTPRSVLLLQRPCARETAHRSRRVAVNHRSRLVIAGHRIMSLYEERPQEQSDFP